MNGPKRILIIVAGAAGACAIAVPAAVGLSGNPSFSERIPVRVPRSAHVITFDDRGRAIENEPHHSAIPTTSSPKAARSTTSTRVTGRAASPVTPAPPTTRDRSSEPGDDHGTHSEPGDDRGRNRGHSSAPATPRPSAAVTDDSGHHGRGGGDDGQRGRGGDDG